MYPQASWGVPGIAAHFSRAARLRCTFGIHLFYVIKLQDTVIWVIPYVS